MWTKKEKAHAVHISPDSLIWLSRALEQPNPAQSAFVTHRNLSLQMFLNQELKEVESSCHDLITLKPLAMAEALLSVWENLPSVPETL